MCRPERKRSWWGAWVVVTATILANPTVAPGQVMRGHLIDAETRAPIDAAAIQLVGRDSASVDAATTDSAGYFQVAAAESGNYRLIARRIGYPATTSDPLRLADGDTLQVEFRISAGAVLLDPVVVTGRRRRPPPDIEQFYQRAERKIFGTFMTREEIEQAHAVRVSDLLRRIPGVQLVPVRYGVTGVRIRGCAPMLIVDGIQARFEPSIDNLVVPMELEGLEVYRSPSHVPVQYGGLRGSCGAIMVWTKRGP
jgi:hypothetical protein